MICIYKTRNIFIKNIQEHHDLVYKHNLSSHVMLYKKICLNLLTLNVNYGLTIFFIYTLEAKYTDSLNPKIDNRDSFFDSSMSKTNI